MNTHIPISLYIHIPWCIKKCPYCDFNSHVARQEIPESAYLSALINDFKQQLSYLEQRKIQTVFIGGGTPSLMSPDFYQDLLSAIAPYLEPQAEITLEANPGTIDYQSSKFSHYREVGINRLSLGIQSLDNQKLKYLGRMHGSEEAIHAINLAKSSGFDNFNCDLMFGLTDQTIENALDDLERIIALKPTHLSWYQLTIEPDTHFYRRPPHLPDDDYIYEMQLKGQELLAQHGYEQYEVSAYSQKGYQCQHNMNYWLFGDYIGIGAGAHGKITQSDHRIIRTEQHKNPKFYMDNIENRMTREIAKNQYLFEFMLNALRLSQEIPFAIIEQRCFCDKATTLSYLSKSIDEGFITERPSCIQISTKGKFFINEVLLNILERESGSR